MQASSEATALQGDERPRADSPWTALLWLGLATPLVFGALQLLRLGAGFDDADYATGFVFFYAAYVVNDPHFAVTYVLFYEDVRGRALGSAFPPAQRVRYWLAGFVAPVVMGAWAISAIVWRQPEALGSLFQLMLLLVGWHYVKQGFGVLVLLSGQRGVVFSRAERIAVLGHGYAAWAYAWGSPAEAARQVEIKGVVYTAWTRPEWFERVSGIALLITVLPLVLLLGRRVLRDRKVALLAPLAVYLITLWWWTVLASAEPLMAYAIPALHSMQYLYVVWLLRRNQAREREVAPYFEKPAATRLAVLAVTAIGLGWFLFHGAPSALDDSLTPAASRNTDLGATPYFAALSAFVNLHHYFMDAVLWRRENPAMRALRG